MTTKPEIVRETYEKRAASFLHRGYRSTWWYLANKALSDWALLETLEPDGATVLNIGCSEPIDEMVFCRRVERWVAVDYSPASIRVAREILDRELAVALASRVDLHVADARRLPFPGASFDIAVAFSTLEHLPQHEDRMQALGELHRVLRPGGGLVVTVPNRWCLPYARWSRRAQREGATDFGYEHLYSPPELRRMLRRAGFEPAAFRSNYTWVTDSRKWPFTWIQRFSRCFGDRMGYAARKA